MLFLHILKIILLILLGLVVLAGLTVSLAPLRLEIRRTIDGSPLKIRISAGFFKIVKSFGGKPQKKKPKPKRQAQSKKQPAKQPKKSKREMNWQNLDLEYTISLILDLMDDMMGSLTFEKLYVTIIVHRGDAGATGEALGGLCALAGMLYPELERRFVLKDKKIVIDADFGAEKTVWGLDISVMTRAGRYPLIAWKRRKQLIKMWRDLTRENPKNISNEEKEK